MRIAVPTAKGPTVKSALIPGKYRTIQITTKSGKQLEAPWNAASGLRTCRGADPGPEGGSRQVFRRKVA
jgi:hypothetical protein